MLLTELFDHLTSGELSQIYSGGTEVAGIQTCDYPKVIPVINMALIEIYKRFPLKRQEVVIQQFDHIQTYILHSKYAESNTASSEPTKYIMDSKYMPFQDNVLKIEEVFDELGNLLYMNDSDEYWSVHTPSYNSIQMPYPDSANQMIATYRASHPVIKIAGLDPATEEIDVPVGYLEALLLYIGARTYAAMNADGDAESNNYMQKFEQACAKLHELNLMNRDNTTVPRLELAGWV